MTATVADPNTADDGAEAASQRSLCGTLAVVARIACIALPLLTIAVAFTGWFDAMTRRAGHLAITIPLVFLFYPPGRRRAARVTLWDLAAAIAALLAFGWVIADRERLMWRLVYVDPMSVMDVICAALAIILVLEGTRRTLGWTLVVMALAFLVYAVAGPFMPGILEHKGIGLTLLLEHLYLVPEGLFNSITGVMATYLFAFLTFGALLRSAGGERLFTQLTHAAAGRWVAGPAKAAVAGSMLMGSVSGSTIANVVTTGTITIPLMKRIGFKPYEAAAIETAAGTGGALMPPMMGAGAFLMAEITGVPLVTILTYSLVPALLYFGSIYGYVHVLARKRGLRSLAETGALDPNAPGIWRTLTKGAHLMLPLAVLVYLLAKGFSPFLAAAACVVGLWLVSYLRRETRMNLPTLLGALESATRGALVLSATMTCSALIVGIIDLTGLMVKTTSIMLALAQGSMFLGIVVVALISTVLGLGLQITTTYVIVATLGAPALLELGVPLLPAHFIMFWFAQTATITPPVCMTAFVAAQIAGAPPMRTGWEAMRVGLALYLVPPMFAYTSLLANHWAPVLIDGFAAMLFLLMFPVVTMGFYQGPIGLGGRLVAIIAGVSFFAAAYQSGLPPTVGFLALGLGLIGGLHLYQLRARDRSLAATSTGPVPVEPKI